jgi:hypothetical protein
MTDPTNEVRPWPSGQDLDRAMDDAFAAAVRRHRAANEPMVMWEDGEPRHVSPFEIALPGEDIPRSRAHADAPAPEIARRKAGGGD